MLEVALLRVGTSVATAVCQGWVKTRTGGRLDANALIGLINSNWTDQLDQRKVRRNFERMAERVVDQLKPYLANEYVNVPLNEITAAALGVADVLESADVTVHDLLEVNLDPNKLRAVIERTGNAQGVRQLLSDGGEAVFSAILREATTYIVEISSSLPTFATAAAKEVLQRESELIELVETVLSQLPQLSVTNSLSHAEQVFETEYRRELARRLDNLELFGLQLSPLRRRYALSVAYITLSIVARSRSTQIIDDKDKHTATGKPHLAGETVRIDSALAESRRILIRGEAGSGKTTLLQWLSVNAARGTFSGRLRTVNGQTPFYVKLRQFVGGSLPTPEEMVSNTAPNSAGQMPIGWAQAQLRTGNCLILVDGVDELPTAERSRARKWLSDLVAMYPECRYVVTTRPPAVAEDWLASEGFAEGDLQPMDVQDIDAFISHWYAAASAGLTDVDDLLELRNYEGRLLGLVRESPHLRALATSPLLCAMLCALHRERRTHLPNDRLELYRIALEMLLDRRDVERELPDDMQKDLTLPQKQILLQDLAYWLLLNNKSDAERGEAIDVLARKLESMRRVETSAQSLYSYLLLRSGLIREPIEGRVDFIHRTFEEYLGAKEAVDQNHIRALIHNAHEDQWREVIILAAGHAQPRQREQLIEGLLNRANVQPLYRHRLQLLAISCLETSSQMPDELYGRLEQLLRDLVPPKNMGEARALSSAGDLAVPILAGHKHAGATRVAATVRALATIGGEAALSALEEYGDDRRVTVARELVRAWPLFPEQEYAQRILKKSILNYGHLEVRAPEQVAAVRELEGLQTLWVTLVGRPVKLETLRGLSALSWLYLHRIPGLGSLDGLQGCNRLTNVTVRESRDLSDLSALTGLEALDTLLVSSCGVSDISVVATLPTLSSFRVLDCPGVDGIPKFQVVDKLTYLDLERTSVSDLDALADLLNLTTLDISGLHSEPEMEWLQHSSVTTLVCNDVKPRIINSLRSARLRDLELRNSGLFTLDFLEGLPNLEVLDVSSNYRLRDISGISSLPRLQQLNLTGLARGVDFSPLTSLRGCTVYFDQPKAILGMNESWFLENEFQYLARYRHPALSGQMEMFPS